MDMETSKLFPLLSSSEEYSIYAALLEISKGRKIGPTATKYGISPSIIRTNLKDIINESILNRNRRQCQNSTENAELMNEFLQISETLKHSNQIFSAIHEEVLIQYWKDYAKAQHGMVCKCFRLFAYGFAMFLKTPLPKTWLEHKQASKDWITLFMRRHPKLRKRYQCRHGTMSMHNSEHGKNIDYFFKTRPFNLDSMINKLVPENTSSRPATLPMEDADKGLASDKEYAKKLDSGLKNRSFDSEDLLKKLILQNTSNSRNTSSLEDEETHRNQSENVSVCAMICVTDYTNPPLVIFPKTAIEETII